MSCHTLKGVARAMKDKAISLEDMAKALKGMALTFCLGIE
jgi:hypothetical protein